MCKKRCEGKVDYVQDNVGSTDTYLFRGMETALIYIWVKKVRDEEINGWFD